MLLISAMCSIWREAQSTEKSSKTKQSTNSAKNHLQAAWYWKIWTTSDWKRSSDLWKCLKLLWILSSKVWRLMLTSCKVRGLWITPCSSPSARLKKACMFTKTTHWFVWIWSMIEFKLHCLQRTILSSQMNQVASTNYRINSIRKAPRKNRWYRIQCSTALVENGLIRSQSLIICKPLIEARNRKSWRRSCSRMQIWAS